MRNPFSVNSVPEDRIKRNPFPLSFQSLFTTEFGRCTPVFTKEVIPGDTFKIGGSIAIQGMPTVFPVQTRIRASLSFFYCRNRCVHSEFEDFIYTTKDVEAPWLRLNNERAKKMISTGSLGDFFNISTTKGNSSNITSTLLFGDVLSYDFGERFNYTISNVFSFYESSFRLLPGSNSTFGVGAFAMSLSNTLNFFPDSFDFVGICNENYTIGNSNPLYYRGSILVRRADGYNVVIFVPLSIQVTSVGVCSLSYDISPDLLSIVKRHFDDTGFLRLGIVACNFTEDPALDTLFAYLKPDLRFQYSCDYLAVVNRSIDATDDSIIDQNLYVGNNPKRRISAYKFRHYTQICNYYFRDDRNNPYILNGESQYNHFIPSYDSGPDDNVYDFYYRPWEKDQFTTAVQSPQFGEAPLVGITVNASARTAELVYDTGTLEDGEGTPVNAKVKVGLNSDGDIISIGDFDDSVPSASLRRLIEGIQSSQGISINDFRVTNAFQRFKENMQLKGLRYRSQHKVHFGVSVDYPDIDIPQYIGGVSDDLIVGKITNQADSPNAGLGDFVGSLSGFLKLRHDITCYCVEHGFIMGILTITPIPTYAQVTHLDNYKIHPFDYYLPEFGKIGYVPIHFSELCPHQTGVDQDPEDVFGYQKAWYEYMSSLDEVHGDFRTSLKDFVLTRTFAQRPTLSDDFVRVKPDQLNDIFVTRNIADAYNSSAKFMCNAYFTVVAKREIYFGGKPSLE